MEFRDYNDFKLKRDEVISSNDIDKLISLYENGLDKFENEFQEISANLIQLYAFKKEEKKLLELLNRGLQRDSIYKIDFKNKIFDYLSNNSDFKKLIEINNNNLSEKEKNSKSYYKIVYPENYNPTIKYPIFIALHGNGQTIDSFKNEFTSSILNKDFITIYIQSSVSYGKGFGWNHDGSKTINDIETSFNNALEELKGEYSDIYAGGFSTGASSAMSAGLNQVIPAKGYILISPVKFPDFTESNLITFSVNKSRISMGSGESDFMFMMQKKMAETLKKLKIDTEFEILKNTEHELNEESKEFIDKALVYIKK